MNAIDKNRIRERKSFCRLCLTHCGTIVSVDADEQVVDVRPDRDDLITEGFACYKGLQAAEAHHAAHRVLHPLKRRADGTFERIGLEQALDEIADKLRVIMERDGPEAIGGYRGSGAALNAAACFALDNFLSDIGSHKIFSASTIDYTGKVVAAGRVGFWPPGAHPFPTSDVALLVGTNPMVSLTWLDPHHPLKRLKENLDRGMKLLIIDPRKTETARFAHVHLQPLSGEDATILAGMVRMILAEGWEDKVFLAAHGSQIDELRAAVAPFTPEYVARRADVPVETFRQLTETFAKAKRGRAQSGTGSSMGPHSNLSEHLVLVLNIICGRMVREGERILNPGVLAQRTPKPCQVFPAGRSWDKGFKSRTGYGQIPGGLGQPTAELPTGIMSDEILTPGPDQIKAFFAHGGNPGVIVPDQQKVVRAYRSLELLVTVDPFMTPTAQLSHYVLPPLMQYERPDFPCWQAETSSYDKPFTRYTPAVAKPPAGAEVVSDEYIFWALCKRLGVQMTSQGVAVDMGKPPTGDDMLAIVARHSPVPFNDLKTMDLGVIHEGEPQYATAGNPGPTDRFTVAPPDVVEEIGQLAAEDFVRNTVVSNGSVATHRFVVRRVRDVWNSVQRELDATKKRLPHNTACLHPDELTKLGVTPGNSIRITSGTAAVDVVVEADDTLRPGIVSMPHGFGVLPEDNDHRVHGACANMLVSTDRDLQTINAMPLMSGFAVNITKLDRLNAPTFFKDETKSAAHGRVS